MPNRSGGGGGYWGLENSSKLNKREGGGEVGINKGGWKILPNLIAGIKWRKFHLIC